MDKIFLVKESASLAEENPTLKRIRILDATSGRRAFWLEKNWKDTTFIDIRTQVEPDVVMDCTKTTFEDKTFNLIVFDPPHCGMTENNKGVFAEKYGTFTAQQIRDTIAAAFVEFDRILKDDGFVVFKWNDGHQSLKTIKPLFGSFVPLFGQISNSNAAAKHTFWITLVKGNPTFEVSDISLKGLTVELTPQEVELLKMLINRHIIELTTWIKEGVPSNSSLYSKVSDMEDWKKWKVFYENLLKKLESMK